MDQQQIRPGDLILINMTPEAGAAVTKGKTSRWLLDGDGVQVGNPTGRKFDVARVNGQTATASVPEPQFPSAEFTRLLKVGKRREAILLDSEFKKQLAEYQSSGEGAVAGTFHGRLIDEALSFAAAETGGKVGGDGPADQLIFRTEAG